MSTFEIEEKYEGLWRVTWPGLSSKQQRTLQENIFTITFSIINNRVGFSTREGERAFTMYIDPSAYWQDAIGVSSGNIRCCMFSNHEDAEKFVASAGKHLTWAELTDILKHVEVNDEEDF